MRIDPRLWTGLLLCTFSAGLFGQTSPEFKGIPVSGGARTASLGSAAVGEAYDASSLYWNPAALSFIQRHTIVLSSIFGRTREVLENTLTSPPVKIGSNQVLAIGIAGSYFGNTWSLPLFAYHGIDLGYSIKFHQTVSLGFRMNFRYGNTAQSGLPATSGAIGAFYSPSPGISYGVAYDGIGLGVKYKDTPYNNDLRYDRDLEQSLRIGAAFKFPSIYRPPYITISLESQKIMGNDRLVYRAGIETYPAGFISLRCGIITGLQATTGTAGIGLRGGPLDVDYSISPGPAVRRTHQVSVSYNFGE